MRFLPLIVKNLFRNRLRVTLTIFLMASIFFFVATLLSILANFEQAENSGAGQNRLGIQSSISLGVLLPLAHEEKIRRIEGVEDVARMTWVAAYYQDQKNFFANFAIDHDRLETVWDDYAVPHDHLSAFKNDRQGAVIGSELARRFGWKIGDRITLEGTIFPMDPELTIRAIYDHKVDDSSLFFRFDYFNEQLQFDRAGMYWVKVRNAEDMPRVADAIDTMFENSDYPTETFTEKEFQQQFISMIGNVKLLFTSVSACAIFMVVLLAAITMSMSARERVTEIAVLKTLGFTRMGILGLMLTEFVLLSLIGGLAGTGGARLLFGATSDEITALTQGFLLNFHVNDQTFAICMITSVLVGIVAGGVPAIRSANLSVVDGLRKVV